MAEILAVVSALCTDLAVHTARQESWQRVEPLTAGSATPRTRQITNGRACAAICTVRHLQIAMYETPGHRACGDSAAGSAPHLMISVSSSKSSGFDVPFEEASDPAAAGGARHRARLPCGHPGMHEVS